MILILQPPHRPAMRKGSTAPCPKSRCPRRRGAGRRRLARWSSGCRSSLRLEPLIEVDPTDAGSYPVRAGTDLEGVKVGAAHRAALAELAEQSKVPMPRCRTELASASRIHAFASVSPNTPDPLDLEPTFGADSSRSGRDLASAGYVERVWRRRPRTSQLVGVRPWRAVPRLPAAVLGSSGSSAWIPRSTERTNRDRGRACVMALGRSMLLDAGPASGTVAFPPCGERVSAVGQCRRLEAPPATGTGPARLRRYEQRGDPREPHSPYCYVEQAEPARHSGTGSIALSFQRCAALQFFASESAIRKSSGPAGNAR